MDFQKSINHSRNEPPARAYHKRLVKIFTTGNDAVFPCADDGGHRFMMAGTGESQSLALAQIRVQNLSKKFPVKCPMCGGELE